MSQRLRYGLVVLASILLSVGGILIGAFVTQPADGGRGGAIAVALAFFVLFVRRDYGARVYAAITRKSRRSKKRSACSDRASPHRLPASRISAR